MIKASSDDGEAAGPATDVGGSSGSTTDAKDVVDVEPTVYEYVEKSDPSKIETKDSSSPDD